MKPPYLLERSLPDRIKKYLSGNSNNDINKLTDYLMENYSEFSRKKRSIFMASVKKSLDYEMYLQGKQLHLQRFSGSNSSPTKPAEDEIQEIPLCRKSLNSGLSAVNKKNASTNQDVDVPEIVLEPKETPKQAKNATPFGASLTPEQSVPRKKRPIDSDGIIRERKLKRPKTDFIVGKPTTDLDEWEGIESLYDSIIMLLYSLMRPRKELDLSKTALISGPTGSGKSSLVRAIAGTVKCSLLKISALDFIEGISGNSEERVREAFDLAVSSSPCILHIDKIDVLSPRDASQLKGLERRICSKIAMCIEELTTDQWEKQVIVLGETTYPERIDLDLKAAFETEIVMPTLDEKSRIEILRLLTKDITENIDFALLAKHTVSFVAGDLKKLVKVAVKESLKSIRDSHHNGTTTLSYRDRALTDTAKYCSLSSDDLPMVTLEHFFNALPHVVPVLKREGFPSVPEVTWEDIGGLAEIKLELKEKVIEPIEYAELHKRFGAQRPNGILLWGPPGCGKTLLAKAVANEAGINFCPVNGPEILNKYQGESERAIREIFERASKAAPCVIFFDEVDSICVSRDRGSSEGGSKSSIVNTLLAEMEGTRRREEVFVMGATNRPDILDPAVTRPGRFDTLIFVDIPDLHEREQILKACTKNGTCPKLTDDVNLADIAQRCPNFSGADCSQLVYIASKQAIREIIRSPPMVEKPVGVSMQHFEAALKLVKPSVSLDVRRRYNRLKNKQGSSQLSLRKGTTCPVFDLDDEPRKDPSTTPAPATIE